MIATRDWFVRHGRQSLDQVDKLRKRVEQNSLKLETTRGAQKDGWQAEADKFAGLIERDQIAISAALARRVFIRFWYVKRPLNSFSIRSDYGKVCGMKCALCCIIERMLCFLKQSRHLLRRSRFLRRKSCECGSL